jgi:hypothetical protein
MLWRRKSLAHTKDGGYKIHGFMPLEVEAPISLEEAMESWAWHW